jgi:uncharacterized membrane protein
MNETIRDIKYGLIAICAIIFVVFAIVIAWLDVFLCLFLTFNTAALTIAWRWHVFAENMMTWVENFRKEGKNV